MKTIDLSFDSKEGLYRTNIPLDKKFFIDLKEKKFLKHISSFEDIPENFLAEIQVLNIEEWDEDSVSIHIYTDVPIPADWKNTAKSDLNSDLIFHDKIIMECAIDLKRENIHVDSDGQKIQIEIPI